MTRRPRAVLALLAFAQLIISLDYNIVYVALPDIGRELGFSAQSLQWVVSAYAVAFGGFLLLGGRACDLFGPRRVFALGCALYAGSSLVGGLAVDPGLLVGARAGQGLGGALLFPATLTLVSTVFAAGRERNRAFAVWGTAGGSGMILGSLLGGVLTQAFGWAAVFFVNVPLAAAAAALAFVLLPVSPAREPGRRFDLAGALTATLGTTSAVFALVEGPELGWTSAVVLTSAAVGVALLAAFAVLERRGRDPLLPPWLLRERNLGTGVVVTFLYMGTFGTLLYFLTGYFQGVHGYGALATGLAFGVPMVAIAAGSQAAGRLATRYGTRPTLVVSLMIGGAGAVLLGLSMTAEASYLALVPALVVLGLGQGAGYTLMFGAAAAGIPPSAQGVASGVASTAQQVGGTVGLAVFVAVANTGTDGLSGETLRMATVDGLRTAVLLAAAGIAVTALAALRFRGANRTEVVPA
ncbi:MFS transporter [Amycolatopsis sp. NPDC048633]|uniref:MFS transporter n=1 Tax=Amycolatopsis sp. NPDC048633 TaxID=3157095 RepID=UPI00340BE31B